MNGAQCVVQLLKDHGVNIVFGYPGGAIMPIYDALFDGGIEHLLCRHEQGAIFAAIGYARATGKVGVCFATSGPGATNLVTGLADALLDSIPVIAITGQVALNFIGTDAFQEIDVLGLSLACTKHSFLVESLCKLSDIINQAFMIAVSGRPGPVLIDIPKDVQLLTDNDIGCTFLKSDMVCINNEVVSNVDIDAAFSLIAKSIRPVLYVGGGVGISGAVCELREFISITGIPVVVTLKGLGSVDYNDSCYLGMLGMHGNQAANLVVQRCDVLIAVGARFDDRVTGQVSDFAPRAKVIHLDIDPSEFNKLRRADITLLGNLKDLLERLSQSLSIDDWRLEVQNLRQEYRWLYDDDNVVNRFISVPAFLKNVSDNLPCDTIVTTDVGQHQMWVAQHMQFNYPENFITSSGLGSMGFGIPAAIGAQVGRPRSTVICISGDGSFMMNVQELGTIKRKKLPIKIILLDNKRLGMVRQWQELFFDKRYCETSLFDNPDFVMLAQSFEINSLSISNRDQISNAIDILFSDTVPFLLHVMIREFDNVWPLVPPGAANDVMLVG